MISRPIYEFGFGVTIAKHSFRIIGDICMRLLQIWEDAEKSLARPKFRCRRTESIMSLERGVPFMCRIARLFLLQRLKRSISGDACDFNNIETRAVINFFFLQGKAPNEIHAILTETLGEHAPSYATVKNWVAQFKRGDFSTCDAPRPGRPKTRRLLIKFTS